MRARLAIVLCAVVGLLCAPAATADDVLTQDPRYAELARVASIFAQQPVTVTCQTPAEDPELYTAWGYVFLAIPEIHLSPYLCDAAVDKTASAGVRSLAILVLVHESYHLRKQWADRGDEAKVECKAIRHFRVGAMLLGETPEQATVLRAFAIAFHWRLAAKIPEYNLEHCKVPRP